MNLDWNKLHHNFCQVRKVFHQTYGVFSKLCYHQGQRPDHLWEIQSFTLFDRELLKSHYLLPDQEA